MELIGAASGVESIAGRGAGAATAGVTTPGERRQTFDTFAFARWMSDGLRFATGGGANVGAASRLGGRGCGRAKPQDATPASTVLSTKS